MLGAVHPYFAFPLKALNSLQLSLSSSLPIEWTCQSDHLFFQSNAGYPMSGYLALVCLQILSCFSVPINEIGDTECTTEQQVNASLIWPVQDKCLFQLQVGTEL